MQVLLDEPRENIFLRPGDNVTVVRDPQSITAMGATGRSGVVPFDTRALSLDEAIGKAGGLNDNQADPDGVFVVRYETAGLAEALPQARGVAASGGWVPVIYHLNMRTPTALLLARKFPMRNKDILYVSNASLSDLRKVLSLVNLLVSPAVTAVQLNAAVP
jgi:polysaccharide export outer membrane protein